VALLKSKEAEMKLVMYLGDEEEKKQKVVNKITSS
jgi:hypothetical protein